ncbi:MAG: PorT family protein [Calditrichaceae bacterium]|nr:PorT family protein [Calditrichia bacterium]NUQ43627.1 PorT family protein [Calditrichaceae bacterium]
MKKFLLILVVLLPGYTANAQVIISLLFGEALNTGRVEFGLDGGVNLASIEGIDGAKNLTAWNLGFYFDIKLNNPSWMIHTGVIVKSTLGTRNAPLYSLNDAVLDSAFSGGSVAAKLQYFDVPIMLKYRFRNNFSLEGGAMLGLLHKASDEFINTVQEEDLSYKRNVKDAYHPLDAGIMIGAGYRLLGGDGINLGVRYYYGLVDTYIDDSTPNRYNRSLYFTVGIPIGAGNDLEGAKQ